jgi:anti-sigma B factor antagonist
VNFSATIRRASAVSIVDLTGHLSSLASGALREALSGLLKQGRRKILLNASGLLYLDSSGVGQLAQCYMSVIRIGGEMKVVGLREKIEEILKITQLYRFCRNFATRRRRYRASRESQRDGLSQKRPVRAGPRRTPRLGNGS